MSHQAVTMVLDHAPEHWPPAKRLVAVALGERINPATHQAWPSIKDLRKRTGLSERSVQLYLRELEAEGWIERAPRQRTNACGQPVSNLWTWRRYILVGVQPTAPGGVQPTAPPTRGGGVQPTAPEPSVVTTRENRK